MGMLDDDMEFAKNLRIRKNQKKSDFEKLVNKKDLTGFELDELFNDGVSNSEESFSEEAFDEE